MTVKQLIHKLRMLPNNAIVYMSDGSSVTGVELAHDCVWLMDDDDEDDEDEDDHVYSQRVIYPKASALYWTALYKTTQVLYEDKVGA